ncbi:MAG: peptidyl-prolyl cis-trans isomerase [Thermotogota bacterium]|nr:peptidyl-prolyl cis-trans isomerase [Thermotogota bacterium]
MRRWLVRRQKIIIWSIAIAFALGVVWWAVAGFISRNTAVTPTDVTAKLSPQDALAYLTKDGTPLDSAYWIFDGELALTFQDMLDYYRTLGAQLDDVFDYPLLKASIFRDLKDQKVVKYYASLNNLLPTKEEVAAELDKQVQQLLSDEQSKQYFLSRYGSVENLKRRLEPRVEISMILSRVKDKVVNVTEDDVKKYYEENLESLKQDYEEARVKHILVSDEATALKLKNEILSGAITFEDAASEFSIDRQSAEQGGELGWIKHGQTVLEFENAAFSATLGELVGPVETIYGFHLLEVEDRIQLDTFDDLKNATQIYSETKSKIENERFQSWKETFINSERLAWVVNDEVMKIYSDYLEGDEEKHKELFEYLDSRLFVSATDSTSVDLASDADEQLMALYVTLAEGVMDDLKNKELDYTRFVNLMESEEFDPSLLEESTETLADKANEYMRLAQEATSDNAVDEYLNTYFRYYDAYLVKDILSRYPDLTTEEAKSKLESVKAQIQELQQKLKTVLYALYEVAPSSQKVLSRLYELDPSNMEVRYAYFKSRYDSIKDYIKDPQIYQAYSQYLQPEVINIKTGLETLAYSSKAATDLRTSALEVLAEMSESIGDLNSELSYLRALKDIDPEYPNIDDMISSIENALKSSATSTTATQSSLEPSTPASE